MDIVGFLRKFTRVKKSKQPQEVVMEDNEMATVCKFFLKYIIAREAKGHDLSLIMVGLKDVLTTFAQS